MGRATRWGLGLGIGALLLHALLGPAATEALVNRGPLPWISWGLSHLTGWLPFAVVELLLLLLILRQLPLLGRGGRGVVRRRFDGRATLAGLARLGGDVGWVVAIFYLAWGLQYNRGPLEERWGWDPASTPITADELEVLGRRLVDATNAAYEELHASEDLGTPTPAPADVGALDRRLEDSWRTWARDLGMPAARRRAHGPVKFPVISPLLSRLGISGAYSPWTGEPNVNATIPAARLAHTMAHEKAHQRGFTSENEANFMGYLVAARSQDPLARYGARLFAQRQVLRTLQRADSARALPLIRARHPGVQRDVDDIVEFWRRYRGRLQRLASRTNDLYLRSHRVEGGRLSYGRSVVLLIHFARRHGGDPLPR